MKKGKMRKCHDCGTLMKVRPNVLRALCRGCARRHNTWRKTKVIVNLYKR